MFDLENSLMQQRIHMWVKQRVLKRLSFKDLDASFPCFMSDLLFPCRAEGKENKEGIML